MCKIVHGEVPIRTNKRFQVLNVTSEVEDWLSRIGARDGILVVYCPHTTAAVAVNEAEGGLLQDIVKLLEDLTKPGGPWMHNRIDSNAHAHLGNILVGSSASIPVRNGRLLTGTWQSVLFIEMDGPRSRRLRLTFVGTTSGE
jgi:secondary thiamine-phosphate synthase enzyme